MAAVKQVLLASGVLGLALLAAGCGKGDNAVRGAATQGARAAKKVPVTVATARLGDLQRSVPITGDLVPLEKVTVSNRVSGVIVKLHADLSDRVKPGQVLVEIEPQRFELAVQQAQGQLSETLARLGVEAVPEEKFDVSQTAPVKKAQSEYELAKSKLERSQPLYEQRIMKEFEFFDIQSAERVAASNLQAARDEARSLMAQARQYKTIVEIRRQDLQDAKITAPDGTTPGGMNVETYAVTKRLVSVGEYVREGTALYELMADSTLKVQARVPERYLSQVEVGKPVLFRVEAHRGEAFQGVVRRIDPSVDPLNRTFIIEAYVDNGTYQNRLRPGSFVQGQLLTQVEKDRVMVPVEAVTSFVGVTKVYVIGEKEGVTVAKGINVETGQQEGAWVEIVRGEVKAGDRLIVSGLSKLVDGAGVEVRAPAE